MSIILLVLAIVLGLHLSVAKSSSSEEIPIPEAGVYLGAYIGVETNRSWTWGPGGQFDTVVKGFESEVGRKLAINHIYNSWDELNSWDNCHWYWCLSQMLETIIADGSIPMISWKPTKLNQTTGHTDVPIKLQEIIDGRYDDYVEDWARSAKSFQYPIFLRFGWEMTYGGNPWSGPQNFGRYGNQSWDQVDNLYKYYGDPLKPDGPERYNHAWKHIHDIFQRLGADNVVWVWSPGVGAMPDVPWNSVENYYPGDDYVDWVGAHVFNFGYFTTQPGIIESWRTFSWIFQNKQAMKVYKRYPSKPFMIAEISCSQEKLPGVLAYHDKAGWIADAIRQIESKYRNVKAVIWFSEDKSAQGGDERDWRVDYPGEVLEAFKQGTSDPYFLDHIPFEYRTLSTTITSTSQTGTGVTQTTSVRTTPETTVAQTSEKNTVPARYEVYIIAVAVCIALGLAIGVTRYRKAQA